jgi:hypothetical protein
MPMSQLDATGVALMARLQQQVSAVQSSAVQCSVVQYSAV